jgi:hypothetical protein
VNGWIGGVVELARHPGAVTEAGQDFLRAGNGPFHPLGSFGQHHLGAQCAQHVPSFHRHRIGHGEDAAKAPGGGHIGQADPGVPTGRLHDGHAGTKPTIVDRIVDHRSANAVFH